jgi:cytochrome c oxidase accessory protein FixG
VTAGWRASGLLGPWRRTLQWALSLTLLGIPFVRLDGHSLLRLDLPTLTLYAGGHALPIEELYLFLFLAIALVLLFLLVTLLFGRAWCGWACPQTTLSDLVEGVRRILGAVIGNGATASAWGKGLLHLFYVGLALLVAANLVWYFVSPYEFFPRLRHGQLGGPVGWTLTIIAGTVYFDLAFIGRLLCKEFCPYGRLQSALIDPGTLTLRIHPDEAPGCIRCGACVRACPMGIDIRAGDQIECINCGRCLDACRQEMARRQQPGIIRYTFGMHDQGARALLNPRMLLVAAALVLVAGVFAATLLLRTEVTLRMARPDDRVARSLSDQQTVNFFLAVVGNRSRESLQLEVQVATEDELALQVHGPAQHFTLQAGERRRLDFAVVTPMALLPVAAQVQVRDTQGRALAEGRIYLVSPIKNRE